MKMSFLCAMICVLSLPVFAQNRFDSLKDGLRRHLPNRRPTVAERGPDCVIDSVLTYGFISPTDSVLFGKAYFYYYGSAAETRYVYEIENAQFVLQNIDSTRFDALGRRVLHQYSRIDFSTNIVKIRDRTLYYYRGNTDLLDSIITLEPEFLTGIVKNKERERFIYDSNDLADTLTYAFWDDFAQNFFENKYLVLAYDNTNKLVKSVLRYNFSSIPYETTTYHYNNFDSVSLVLIYNNITNQNVEKDSFVYDLVANSRTAFGFRWNPDLQDWVFGARLFYDYNDTGTISILEIVYTFFEDIEGIRFEYKYLPNSECLDYADVYFKEGTADWIFTAREHYWTDYQVSINEGASLSSKGMIYPNPSDGVFTIDNPSECTVQIFNMNGVMVYEDLHKSSLKKVSCALNPGIYVIKIRDVNQVYSRKLLVR